MGLLDFTSRVTTTYRADVKDHISELQKLKGAEKDHAKDRLEQQKAVNAGLEDQIKVLGKVALAGGAAAGVAALAWDGFKDSLERGRLVASAAGADVERLRTASHGLKTEMELLRDAAKMQSGAFKLSQEQMETAERAMLAFQRRGVDTAKSQDAVLQAVTALKTEGLKDLGVFVDTAGLSMETADGRAKIFTRTMAELAKVSMSVKDGQSTAAEQVLAAGTSIQDSFALMKTAVGELVLAMRPLIGAFASTLGVVANIIDQASGSSSRQRTEAAIARNAAEQLARRNGLTDRQRQVEDDTSRANALIGAMGYGAGAMSGYKHVPMGGADQRLILEAFTRDNDLTHAAAVASAAESKVSADIIANGKAFVLSALSGGLDPWGNKLAKGPTGTRDMAAAARRIRGEASNENADEYSGGSYGVGMLGINGYSLGETAGMDGLLGADITKGTGNALRTREWNKQIGQSRRNESKLTEMFGSLTEFNAYKTAFDSLSGAVGSAMTAWIDGSMSAGKAFKAFIGEAVKGVAVQMAMEAIKHGAYAIGSLAFGDFRGAATHGKAAAAFAAGAVVAAVAAKQLSSGASTGGAAGGVGPGSVTGPRGSSAPQYQGRQEIIVIGDSFGENTARGRIASTRRRLAQAGVGMSGVVDG